MNENAKDQELEAFKKSVQAAAKGHHGEIVFVALVELAEGVFMQAPENIRPLLSNFLARTAHQMCAVAPGPGVYGIKENPKHSKEQN